ncbi:hypothetical protein [Kocuria rosea]|uniref:hypothetical protein n=1 Tax=Kocuria rosea TaxID=1275 RepID=UPI00232C9D89|nr:hypothetical protein [Kocuria rosea]
MRITEHYLIHADVPFLDVHLDHDNQLFLDPSAIRNATGPRARQAQALLQAYFTEVLRLRQSAGHEAQTRGRALLAGLHEPNENRLGFSQGGVGGHAIGPGIADDLWDLLGNNPAAVDAALTRIEDIPLFIHQVGDDLISDLTTRIIYPVLAQFTSEMVQRYPALGQHLTTERIGIYSPQTQTWEEEAFTLPYAFDRQILLIPKNWVFWRLLMDPDAFYNRFATTSVQEERQRIGANGRLWRPSKASLNDEFTDHKQLNTDRAAHHRQGGRDLVAEYRAQVDQDFEPLTDEELHLRTAA